MPNTVYFICTTPLQIALANGVVAVFNSTSRSQTTIQPLANKWTITPIVVIQGMTKLAGTKFERRQVAD